jgi:hypothetical protein
MVDIQQQEDERNGRKCYSIAFKIGIVEKANFGFNVMAQHDGPILS